jgi:hypothetical protein
MKVVLQFRRVAPTHVQAYIKMTSRPPLTCPSTTNLGQYYIRQAGGGRFRGRGRDTGIGPVYSIPPFIQRGHGIGSVLRGLFRTVRSIFWSGAKFLGRETFKALGRETLRTGCKIMTDIADNPQTSVHDVVSKHLSETTQNVLQKLRGGGGRKRKRAPSRRRPPRKVTGKRARVTKPKRKRKSSSKHKPSETIKRGIFS